MTGRVKQLYNCMGDKKEIKHKKTFELLLSNLFESIKNQILCFQNFAFYFAIKLVESI